MEITAQEKLMYDVMMSIYDSPIPMSFKGSMVLKAYLSEMGYSENTRHTTDIDANWNSETSPTMEQIVVSVQAAIDKRMNGLRVAAYREYGDRRSAGLEVREEFSGDVLFTMDVDVNRPVVATRLYEISGIKFSGIVPSQMITDKVCSISTDKVFRRIKDMVDLYYFSKVFQFDKDDVVETAEKSGREIGDFHGFINRMEEVRHSYEKFRFEGNIEKPEFETVYRTVKQFVRDVLPESTK